jgi:hypothetical protein
MHIHSVKRIRTVKVTARIDGEKIDKALLSIGESIGGMFLPVNGYFDMCQEGI